MGVSIIDQLSEGQAMFCSIFGEGKISHIASDGFTVHFKAGAFCYNQDGSTYPAGKEQSVFTSKPT